MATPLPIACSLSSSDYRERMGEIAALGGEALIECHAAGGRHTLTFRAGSEVEWRLERIVAAEAECCAFLGFELGRSGDEVTLVITAPGGAEGAAGELAAAFVPQG